MGSVALAKDRKKASSKHVNLRPNARPTPDRRMPPGGDAYLKLRQSNDPMEQLEALRIVVVALDHFQREVLYSLIGGACELADRLKRSKKEWRRFCAHEYWSGVGQPPRSDNRSDCLRFVLRYMYRAEKGNSSTPNFYLQAVRELQERGVKPDKIAEALKEEGGLRKLAEARAGRKMRAKAKRSRSPSQKTKVTRANVDQDYVQFVLQNEAFQQLATARVGAFVNLGLEIVEMTHPIKVNVLCIDVYDD